MSVKQWIRWLAPIAILVVLAIFFRDQLPFLGQAQVALRDVSWLPLLAAFGVSVLAMSAMAGVMQLLLNVEGRIANPAKTNAVVYASNAWSTTIPGGPAIATWFTYRVNRSWGASPGLCGWFIVVSGALATVWMGIIALAAVVFLGADISVPSLAASLAAALAAMAALFWAMGHPQALKGKFKGRFDETIDQIADIHISRQKFAAAALLSLCNQILDVAAMYFSVWAVLGAAPGTHADLNQTTVMGIALAYLMTKVAGTAQITPGGVGTVEPVAVGMLVAAGMTLVDATAATVIYRLVSFVIITVIGWVIYAAVYAGRGYMVGKGSERGLS